MIINIIPSQKETLIRKQQEDQEIYSFQYFHDYSIFRKNFKDLNPPLYVILEKMENLDYENMPKNDLYFDLSRLSLHDIPNILILLNNKDNVFFKTKYDTYKYATKEEIKITSAKLTKMITPFISMSPAEITLCLYDLVRTRPYISYENPKTWEDYGYGRDLCQIMNYQYFVCSGYANLFASLLELANITSEILIWENKDKNIRHASNLVYLNDAKYNIHGIYAFDLTYDRIKKENIPVLDYHWNFFSFYYNVWIRYKLDRTPTYLGKIEKLLNDIQSYLQSHSKQDIINSNNAIIHQINNFHRLIGYPLITQNISFKDLKALINQLLFAPFPKEETLKKLLINCREYEKLFNAQLFSLKPHDLEKIIATNLYYQDQQEKRIRQPF